MTNSKGNTRTTGKPNATPDVDPAGTGQPDPTDVQPSESVEQALESPTGEPAEETKDGQTGNPPAEGDTPADGPKPARKPRLSATERLKKQLEDALAKERERAGNKLEKAREELDKANTDLERAQARRAKALDEVRRLEAQVGGNDPIVTAEVEHQLELDAAAKSDED